MWIQKDGAISLVGLAKVLGSKTQYRNRSLVVLLTDGLDGWMDGWMDGWVRGWVGGWMDDLMAGWLTGWLTS